MSKAFLTFTFILLLNLVMEQNSYGQIKDFQNWNSISLEKNITKKTSVVLEEEFRFENNATQFQSVLTSLGGEYKINKYVKVKGLYRFTYANNIEDGSETEHRFSGDVMLRYKLSRFMLNYRARYQMEYIDFDVNTWHGLRNKFGAKYDIPKTPLMPFAEFEIYTSLNHPIQNGITRTRYTIGADYEISKLVNVSAYYRLQIRQGYYKYPQNKYILGIGIGFTI